MASKEEIERSKKRLKRFEASRDSTQNDDGTYNRFLKHKKKNSNANMSHWLLDDPDMKAAKQDVSNEKNRLYSLERGQGAMKLAKSGADSSSVRQMRDAGMAEPSIANQLKEVIAYREAMKKRKAKGGK